MKIERPAPLCGIFIGGESRRMGGRAKGLLRHPATGQPLVTRLASLAQELGLSCVLCGQRPEYAALNLPMLADSPSEIGPLGGLGALLEHAAENGHQAALALSCDLPHVSAALLTRLLSVAAAEHDVVAPLRDGRFEPLCALYFLTIQSAFHSTLAAGERSFQRLLSRARVLPLSLNADEARQLDDWDCPEDLEALALHS